MIVLIGVAIFVWLSQPRPAVVEPTPTPSPRTASEVQEQIDAVRTNPKIPATAKGRILGLLNAELEKAKAHERGAPASPLPGG